MNFVICLQRNKWCNNSHTSSTRIDLYDIPHIFYKRIIHTHCLWMLTGYYKHTDTHTHTHTHIYIYISIKLIERKLNGLSIVCWVFFQLILQIYLLCIRVFFICILIHLYISSHTLSTPIELYETSYIIYFRIILYS